MDLHALLNQSIRRCHCSGIAFPAEVYLRPFDDITGDPLRIEQIVFRNINDPYSQPNHASRVRTGLVCSPMRYSMISIPSKARSVGRLMPVTARPSGQCLTPRPRRYGRLFGASLPHVDAGAESRPPAPTYPGAETHSGASHRRVPKKTSIAWKI